MRVSVRSILLYVYIHNIPDMIILVTLDSVRKQLVNIPSYVVRLDSQKHIDFSLKSPYGGGRPGRVKRKKMRKAAGGGGDDDEDED